MLRSLVVSLSFTAAALTSLASCHHDPPPSDASKKEEGFGGTIEDDEAWTIAHPARCKSPVRPSDCNGVREYLADFPAGKHAAEAKQMLAAMPNALGAIGDETRWVSADADGCKVADDIGACDDVAAYLEKFPSGKHAGEARALLEAAEPKLAKLRKALDDAGIDVQVLGTDHSGKDCPPILDDNPADGIEHHALCVVFDVRARKTLKTASLAVKTDCGVAAGQPKKLHWATGADLTKLPIGKTTDIHLAVPRADRCTIEIGIGNVPTLEKEGLRRFCLIAHDDPTRDRAESGSCTPAKPSP